MGDARNTLSLYSIFEHAVASPAVQLLGPWAIFVFSTGFGVSFIVRRAVSPRVRAAAIAATTAGFIFFLHQSLPIFPGHTQQTLPFLPPIEYRAGIGLWLILFAQCVALRLAWRLPRESTGAER